MVYMYFILFVGICLEGEISLLTSMVAARNGLLSVYVVTLVAFVATLLVDWGLFFTGKLLGSKLMRIKKIQQQQSLVSQWIRNNPTIILVSYRYIYGFRIVVLLVLGASKVPVKKFLPYSLVGISIWTLLFSFLGYYFGGIIEALFPQIENIIFFIFVGAAITILIIVGIKFILKKAFKI